MENQIILQVGVKALLKNKEGKYLLLRRSLEKYPDIQGRWDIVGGRIDPGTTLLANLQREVSEETGLRLVGEPQLVAAQDIMRSPGKHVVRLTYIGEVEGDLVLDVTENDKSEWYSWEDIVKVEDLDVYFKEILGLIGGHLR